MPYSFSVELKMDMDAAIEKLKGVLAQNKLGIISDINVAGIIKNKLGENMPAYRILGACNPTLAKRVIEAAPHAGTLLPCNIVARSISGKTVFDFMDPTVVLALESDPEVRKVSEEAILLLKDVKAGLDTP